MAGGFAERAVVPAYTVHPVPDGVSLEAAAIVEPLAVAWHALDRAGQRPGGSVLVLGAGPVGLATLMAARARGAGSVVVAAHREGARSEAARRVGADGVLDASSIDVHAAVRDLVGGGVDVVVETSGAQEALTAGLASVAPLGTVVSLAVWPEPPRVDVQDLMLREVTLLGSKVYRHGDFAEVLSALADGRLAAPERIVSTRLTLDAAVDRGFAALVDDPAAHVKVLVTPRPSPD
jgi:threonine dehydrogenase-like Zn-dependent dehydrogenase